MQQCALTSEKHKNQRRGSWTKINGLEMFALYTQLLLWHALLLLSNRYAANI